MAIDWSLAPRSGGVLQGALEGYDQGKEAGRQNAVTHALQGFEDNPEGSQRALIGAGEIGAAKSLGDIIQGQKVQARRDALMARYKTDPTGAMADANADPATFDMAQHWKSLTTEQQATAQQHATALARLLNGIKTKFPDEAQRRDFVNHIAPDLGQQWGITQAEIDKADLSDNGIQALISSVTPIADQNAANKITWHDVGAGATSVPTHANGSPLTPQEAQQMGLSGGVGASTSAAVPAATPVPTGSQYAHIGELATQAGAKPEEVGYLSRLAQVESGGRQDRNNGKSTGTFQFHPDTFAGVGGTNINDVGDQTKAALTLSRRDRGVLQQAGIEPTDANVYIMHQQGAGGGKALLTAPPDVGAVAVLTPIYGNAATARKAIVRNGGTADMTAGQFTDMWRQRWAGGKPGAAPPAGGGQAGELPGTIHGAAKPKDAPSGFRWSSDGNLEAIPGGPNDPGGDQLLTGDALDMAGQRYMANGTLPPLGQGKVGTANRTAVLNRAAEIQKATGMTGQEAVAQWEELKANSRNLTDATKRASAIQSFEDAALRNADLTLSLAPKGAGPTNTPVLNRWIQAGRKKIAGDADVNNFDIAMNGFATEYARVISGATSSAGSTDTARKEAYDRLSHYASPAQLEGGIATMKTEMENTRLAQQARVDQARAGLRRDPKPAAAAASATAPGPPAAAIPPAVTREFRRMNKSGELDTSVPIGTSAAHPYVAQTQAKVQALPDGAFYMNANGDILRRKR